MKIGQFETDSDILIIAEIGNNHEGDYALAERLVWLAAESGAHAVKFQTFRAEYLTSRRDEERFRRLKSFELTWKEFERLSRTADEAGVLFLSTPLDLESARFLKDIAAAYKIASGDNNFYPLLEYVATTGKPVIMSSGLADIAQLKRSQGLIQGTWRDHGIEQSLAVLHCVSGYPVPRDQVNLAAIGEIRRELGCTVGYSDHTLGIEAAVFSAAMGARIIEKHFTIDKNFSEFRDHQLSVDPGEMKLLVWRVNKVCEMLGSGTKVPQEVEAALQGTARRSIVARRDLPEGTVLSWDDLTWIRPAAGLPPGEEGRLLGRTLSVPLPMGEAILPEHVTAPEI